MEKRIVAAIAGFLAIGFVAASTSAHAADSCAGPLSVSLPASSVDDGDLFCTPLPGGVQLIGFSCSDPYYTGSSTPQGLTFVMPNGAYKLPKKLRYPADPVPGGCVCGPTCCGCGH